MEGCYAESGVSRKMKPAAVLALIGMTALITGSLLLTLVNQWGALLLAASVIAAFIFYRYLRVEYEYIFVTGELQIDKIYSGSVRKPGPRVDMSDVESVEPVKEEALANAKASGRVKIEDYTSHRDEYPAYMVVYRGKEGVSYLLFEPNENMLKTMWRHSPSKVRIPKE
ncbi:MAG: hypothetical protein J5794_08330 [Lachnospiraceae bacterium]|nr:hypothetical protein [Lachnospiraceae bacterium]